MVTANSFILLNIVLSTSKNFKEHQSDLKFLGKWGTQLLNLYTYIKMLTLFQIL